VLTATRTAPMMPERTQVRGERRIGMMWVLVWLAIHLLLGLAAQATPHVATAHAVAAAVTVVALGTMTTRPDRLVLVMMYAGTSDVFWRMTRSRAPWEFSKYLLAFGALAILLRVVPRGQVKLGAPALLLLMLLPGVVVTVIDLPPGEARGLIAMAELGLIAFALCATAFRHVVASLDDAWNAGWVLLGPLVSILAVTTHAVLTRPDIDFGGGANFEASGGFGPNQVATSLGLLVLVLGLLALIPGTRSMWPLMAGLAAWATWSAFLTMSRGGLYSIAIAAGAMALVGSATKGARLRSLTFGAVGVVGAIIIFSSANNFSGNWLESRYDKQGSSGRDTIAELELEVFRSHPLFGVGSGQVPYHRPSTGHLASAASHTEYTRLLAEHGVFGIAALCLMVVSIFQGSKHALTPWNRLMVAAFGAWGLATMVHSATRVAAVPLLLALTQIRVERFAPGRPPQSAARTQVAE